VQGKNFPNLYTALADLSRPLVDFEKSIENEKKVLGSVSDEASGYDQMRLIARRLENHLNSLQVVEAVRNYAAVHDGQLPPELSDIKDMKVPNDLISGTAFEYHKTAAGATLKSAIPEGGRERDSVNYEIVIRK
jgi:hypothetical protein